MPQTRYHIGDQVDVTTEFKTVAGVLTSPSTVVGSVRKPDGTVVTLTPAATSAGVWKMTLPVFDQAGIWRWKMKGTAGLISADEGSLYVLATGVP